MRGEPDRPAGHQPLNVAHAYRPGERRGRSPVVACPQTTPDRSRLWEADGVALNCQRGPWKVDLDFAGTTIHIRPRADLWWHPLDPGCWCTPVEETAPPDGGIVIAYLHNAADGRLQPIHG